MDSLIDSLARMICGMRLADDSSDLQAYRNSVRTIHAAVENRDSMALLAAIFTGREMLDWRYREGPINVYTPPEMRTF